MFLCESIKTFFFVSLPMKINKCNIIALFVFLLIFAHYMSTKTTV